MSVAAAMRSRGAALTLLHHLVWIFVVLAAWQMAVELGYARALVVSTPLRVLAEFLALVQAPGTWSAIAVTLSELAVGLSIGGVIGVVLGSIFARSRLLDRCFRPLVVAFYTLPRLALLPLFVVWFGLGGGSKIAVVVVHGVVVFLLGAYAAISGIDRRMVEACRIFGAGPARRLWLVYLPAAVPYLTTSARQVVGLALGSVIVAEVSGAFAGIGFELALRLARFDMTGVLAWVVLVALLALAFDRVGLLLERRTARWASIRDGH